MCGRYSLICTDDLGNRFRVYEPTIGCRSRFNVAPSQVMPVVVQREHAELVPMEWGLVPHWARDLAAARRPINARAETLTERPMFRGLLRHNRCLVPASGFYEWKRDGTGRKQPYYLRLKDAGLFAFAGLYDVWHDMDGSALATYTLVTTVANEVVSPLHDRMPVILRREDEEGWVSGSPPPADELHDLLGPYPAGEMVAYAVSPRVNSPAADDPYLIAPLEEA
jgi:putative SOS response-associated peptidase YedK